MKTRMKTVPVYRSHLHNTASKRICSIVPVVNVAYRHTFALACTDSNAAYGSIVPAE